MKKTEKKKEKDKAEDVDPREVSRGSHWLHVASCGLALYNISYLQHWVDWPDPVQIFGGAISLTPSGASAVLNLVSGAVLTAAGVFAVRRFVDEDTVGATHEKQASWLTAAAGATATAWMISAEGEPSRPLSAVLLVLWCTVFGVLYVILRAKEPERIRAKRAEADEKKRLVDEYKLSREERQRVATYREIWHPWFEEYGVQGRIIGAKDTRGGYTLTIGPYTDEETNQRVYPSYNDLTSVLPKLAARAAEYYETTEGSTLGTNAFQLEETEAAHKVLLHVNTTDFLKGSHPHPGPKPPVTITQPLTIGVYEDGDPLTLDMVGVNGIMVGSTGSGKSTVGHNIIESWAAAHDAEVWVAGMRKLMPMVGPWIDPWLLGLAPRPPIQRIAGEDPDEVLRLLADFYRVANEYNKRLLDDKRVITPDEPAMILIIDESSTIAHYTDKEVDTYDGRSFLAEELFNEICQVCRSAGLGVFFLTQFGLVDALGKQCGTSTLRNVNNRIVGRTNSDSDGRSVLNAADHVRATRLRDNRLKVQTLRGRQRLMAAKVFDLRTREQIQGLAIAYADRRRHLPAWLVQQLGESYTGRWNPERQPDLVARCRQLGVPYPELTPDITGEHLLDVDVDDISRIENAAPAGLPQVEERPSLHGNPKLATALERLAAENAARRTRNAVLDALVAEDAPDWVSTAALAKAAHLTDDEDAEHSDVERDLIELFTGAPYSAQIETNDNGERGWTRDTLLSAIRAVVDSEAAATAPNTAIEAGASETGPASEAERVLDALDAFDDEWVRVSDLGRQAGVVTDHARKQAAMFSRTLRKTLRVPGEAFKASSGGTLVNVAMLREHLTREG
jgi:hypothetical protein